MNKEEIKWLQSCGFTIAEIMAMYNGDLSSVTLPGPPSDAAATVTVTTTPEAASQPQDPAPADPPVPAQDPEPAVDNGKLNESFNHMMDDFKNMFEQQLGLLQSANLRKAVQQEEEKQTPEDLIANIIHPTMKERRR